MERKEIIIMTKEMRNKISEGLFQMEQSRRYGFWNSSIHSEDRVVDGRNRGRMAKGAWTQGNSLIGWQFAI